MALGAIVATMRGMNLLEVTKLVKSYKGRVVVDDVSFLLEQQEIVGLLGRNGAGKTTTFRMILGMIEPDRGAVAWSGSPPCWTPTATTFR